MRIIVGIIWMKKDDNMQLGEKLASIRKEKKLSQTAVAEAVGISRDAISKYERGDIVPSVENARKIAEVLGVSLDYLVNTAAEEPSQFSDVTVPYRKKQTQILTVELLHDQALGLLQQLERLHILRLLHVREQPTAPRRPLAGSLSKESAEKMLRYVAGSREEWERNI